MSSSPSLQPNVAQRWGRRAGWLAALGALLIAIGTWVQSSRHIEPPTRPEVPPVAAISSAPTSPALPRTPNEAQPTGEEFAVFENAPALAVELRGLSWEAQIEAILDSQLPERSKAQLLLQQLPHVPGEAQAPLAEAAVQVLPDSAYSTVALRTLLDPRTHGAAESVLFADLLERPDPVALPALLQLMQMKNHPFAASAQDTLALLLAEDYGADMQAWSAAVEKHLTTSP